MTEDAIRNKDTSGNEILVDSIHVPVIQVCSDDSDQGKCNVEFIELEQGEVLKYSDGIVALSDGTQWLNIPIAEVNIRTGSGDIERGEDETETLMELSEENCEEIEIPIEAEVEDEHCDSTQVVVLEDGRFAYVHTICSEESSESENKGLTLEEKVISENPKLKKRKPKNFVCSEPGCERAYSTLHHLKVHSRNHTGDKPFKCTFQGCTKAFSTDYSRKAHLRTHTGESPYCCPSSFCTKKFKTSGDLQKHIRVHTGERPFVCPIKGCNRSFTTSNIRKVHIRTHTGERPYVCTHDGCNRGFASSTNYKNHMRIHSGEKPYSCGIPNCSKRFTEYSSLYKHQLVHSQQKRHQCNFCSKTYRQSSTLTTHKRTSHGVISADDGTEIILEEMIGIGESGSKNFNDITSKLLKLKQGETATFVTIEDESAPVYIVSDVENVGENADLAAETEEQYIIAE